LGHSDKVGALIWKTCIMRIPVLVLYVRRLFGMLQLLLTAVLADDLFKKVFSRQPDISVRVVQEAAEAAAAAAAAAMVASHLYSLV
jgi:hypothetical protein